MVTIGNWNEDGQMTEEFLYRDNAAFMKQICWQLSAIATQANPRLAVSN